MPMPLVRAAGVALFLLPLSARAQTPPRVADYTLTATLDPARHTVRAAGTIRWTNPSRVAVREMWLHQYLNAFAGPRTSFMRTSGDDPPLHPHWGGLALEQLRADDGTDLLPGSTLDPEVPDDASQLHVTLPRAVAPGESIELAVRFTATLPEAIARTGYDGTFHLVGQWFPKVAVLEEDGTWAHFPFHAQSEFYADFGRYDLRLRYPRGYTVGATGPRVEGPALVDGLMEERHVLEGVHDFAFTAWNHFRHADRRVGDVEVHVLYAPGDALDAARTLDVMSGALPAFERRFGKYPYPVLTVVLPPPGAEATAGMEYPTFITTATAASWWAPRRARFLEYVTVHEFGHQFFYGLVASNEHRYPFLDEGFCEYATARVMEDLFGRGGPLLDLPLLGPRLDTWAYEAFSGAGIRHPLPLDLGADAYPSWARLGEEVYARTAVVLRTLERRVGTARFTAMMRAYVDRARFTHPTPATFYGVVRDELGPPWESFARTAIETPWRYNLAVTEASSAQGADHRWRGRAVIDREGPFELPVNVVLTDVHGRRSVVRIANDAPLTIVPYEGPAALRSVVVDPEETIPLESRRLDNARTADDHPAPTLPLVARVAYWVALALGSVGP